MTVSTSTVTRMVLFVVAAAFALVVASCGGGAGTLGNIGPGDGTGNKSGTPAPGTADLFGRLVQSGSVRVASQTGQGLSGVVVKLINTITGQLVGSDTTDFEGKFEFRGIPSGDGYLVKIEFESATDLDGDGRPDEIELYFQLDLADQAVMELLQEIGVSDSDGDGQLDALEIKVEVRSDDGTVEHQHRQHRRRGGETRIDENGDGNFEDETGIADSDSDGIPDASFEGGVLDASSSDGIHELEVKGFIEAISPESITVGGTTYALTNATTWRIDDNRNADPAQFEVGMFVEVEGFSDGSGGWIATKVKTDDDFVLGDDNPGDAFIDELEVKGFIEEITPESITVGGATFALAGSTIWRIGHDRNADPASFAVGMFVEAEGFADGDGGWIAKKIKLEDNSSEDDSSSGSDEGEDDEQAENEDDSSDDSGSHEHDDEHEDEDEDEDEDDNSDDSGSDEGDDENEGEDEDGEV